MRSCGPMDLYPPHHDSDLMESFKNGCTLYPLNKWMLSPLQVEKGVG
jgi:hypothetical protein